VNPLVEYHCCDDEEARVPHLPVPPDWRGPFSTMADEEVYYPTSYCSVTSQTMSEIMIFYSYGSYKRSNRYRMCPAD
jgi:hypothetical protein